MTLQDSPKFIFSLELRGGRSRYVARDGLITDPFGQVHVPANLSAQQAEAAGLLMSGTYGPPCIGLSASAALSWSLANNLAALTQTTGSTLYKLTWKRWAMPSGRLRFRLRASVRRTRETALIGWPTPTASNTKNAIRNAERIMARKDAGRQSNLQDVVNLAAWPTPTATDGKGGISGREDTKRKIIDGQARCGCAACGLAHANHEQRPLTMSAGSYADVSRQWNKDTEEVARCCGVVRPGPVNGFWRDADWLHCRDGKWRPVRPGSFPLANGVPSRVGRLRAYGNAINIEAATAFIKAYMASVDHV